MRVGCSSATVVGLVALEAVMLAYPRVAAALVVIPVRAVQAVQATVPLLASRVLAVVEPGVPLAPSVAQPIPPVAVAVA
jgi:hypothetical protein